MLMSENAKNILCSRSHGYLNMHCGVSLEITGLSIFVCSYMQQLARKYVMFSGGFEEWVGRLGMGGANTPLYTTAINAPL